MKSTIFKLLLRLYIQLRAFTGLNGTSSGSGTARGMPIRDRASKVSSVYRLA